MQEKGLSFIMMLLIWAALPLMAQNGKAWVQMPFPTQDPLHNIFFLNEHHGWIITYGTAKIFATSDGGKHWTLRHDFEQGDLFFEDLHFSDPQHGWLIGDFNHVLYTADGGITWTNRAPIFAAALTNPSDNHAQGVRVLYYGLRILAPEHIWLSGMWFPQDKPKERKTFHLESRDQGMTWQPMNGPPQMVVAYAFGLGQRGYAAGGSQIFRTDDLGRHWDPVFPPNNQEAQGPIRGLISPSEDVVWACNFSGHVLFSQDGGDSWRIQPVAENRWRDIAVLDDGVVVVAGDRNEQSFSLFESYDSGNTWHPIPLDSGDIHRLYPGKRTLWAVGKEGTVLKRSNGTTY